MRHQGRMSAAKGKVRKKVFDFLSSKVLRCPTNEQHGCVSPVTRYHCWKNGKVYTYYAFYMLH